MNNMAMEDISKTALRVTYTIWLARGNKMFGSWELEESPDVPTAGRGRVHGSKALNPGLTKGGVVATPLTVFLR